MRDVGRLMELLQAAGDFGGDGGEGLAVDVDDEAGGRFVDMAAV